jgi:hypothetical protein
MKKLHMQLVSLFLLLGLTAFCGNIGSHRQALNASQPATFHANVLLVSGSLSSASVLADGTDPVPPPMPLPGAPKPIKPPSSNFQPTGVLVADGTDPVPPPMPLPGAPKPIKPPPSRNFQSTGVLVADGTDPVPPPMPLPGAPKPVKPPSLTA